MMLMDILRKIGIGICALLLGPTLIIASSAFAFQRTVGNPDYVKTTLGDGKIYEAVGSQIKLQTQNEGENQPKFVKKALKNATDSTVLKEVIESGIDNVFAFLKGDIKVEEISIDITPVTSVLDKELITQLKSEIDKLPTCSGTQAPTSSDPTKANCIPKGTNEDKFATQAIDDILGEEGILADNKLTLQDIQTVGQSGGQQSADIENLNQSLNQIASLYQLSRWLTPFSILLSLLFSAAIILLSKSRLHGVRRAGWIILLNGLLLFFISLVANFGAQTFIPQASGISLLGDTIQGIAKTIISDVTKYNKIIGIVFFIIGLAMTIVSSILIKKHAKDRPEADLKDSEASIDKSVSKAVEQEPKKEPPIKDKES